MSNPGDAERPNANEEMGQVGLDAKTIGAETYRQR
jgi:hypothetical protein